MGQRQSHRHRRCRLHVKEKSSALSRMNVNMFWEHEYIVRDGTHSRVRRSMEELAYLLMGMEQHRWRRSTQVGFSKS